MADVACPRCDNKYSPRLLSASEMSVVTYYRCPECSHVWAVDKDKPSQIHHITPFDRRSTEKP